MLIVTLCCQAAPRPRPLHHQPHYRLYRYYTAVLIAGHFPQLYVHPLSPSLYAQPLHEFHPSCPPAAAGPVQLPGGPSG
jgi:hypothetical protein